jgi:hypothetical protein
MYRNDWKLVGLPGDSASASVAPPPARGFVRLYHLCSSHYAIENIRKKRLKVCTVSECNDPFELSVFTSERGGKQTQIDEFKARIAKRYGIVCFSEDWLNPVYWSHYANRHRGIALGFDVAADIALRVQYQNNRVAFPRIKTTDIELVGALFSVKFSTWSYERERRIILDLEGARAENGIFFQDFGPDLVLREVILGALCSEDVQNMRSLVNDFQPDVHTYKATLATGSFDVVPDVDTVVSRSSKAVALWRVYPAYWIRSFVRSLPTSLRHQWRIIRIERLRSKA